ncbi:MAG TPA: hypothetical protein VF974_01305 [Patescibacteria group bacterium]
MLTTTKLVDGVQVIQLATAELDPANGMRKVSERLHLDYILRELALRNPLPIMVDLTRLSDLTGWELADFVHVLSWAKSAYQLEKLVVITNRPRWGDKLQHQYRDSVWVFPQSSPEALKAAIGQVVVKQMRERADTG